MADTRPWCFLELHFICHRLYKGKQCGCQCHKMYAWKEVMHAAGADQDS